MNTEYRNDPQRGFPPLPADLQARLDLIKASMPRFWELRHFDHFTNHGPAHSERVYRNLNQLTQVLPGPKPLNDEEVFIVSAAAWLYDVGMQSPNPSTVLGFDCPPGTSVTSTQLLDIRKNKHVLTKELIINSTEPNSTYTLGLQRDEYTPIIAEVCFWCSSESIEKAPKKYPIRDVIVRIDLLAALLRLADQLYIDSARVNLDLLTKASLSDRLFSRWWLYHYTLTLPIQDDQISFHYSLPAEHAEYLKFIRGLIEPDFEFENNPDLRYLWEKHHLRLILKNTKSPSFTLEEKSVYHTKMGVDLINFLRTKVQPKETIISERRTAVKPRCLMLIDYENLILQLGIEGHFYKREVDLGVLVKKLGIEATTTLDATIKIVVFGHWQRSDMISIANHLRNKVHVLSNIDEYGTLAKAFDSIITKEEGTDEPLNIILVAPPEELAQNVEALIERKYLVTAWINDVDDAAVYTYTTLAYKTLKRILQLPDEERLNSSDFDYRQEACILRLENELIRFDGKSSLEQIAAILDEIECVKEQSDWWRLWLLRKGILVPTADRGDFKYQLDKKHPDVVRVQGMWTTIINTLQNLSTSEKSGVDENQLLKELKALPNFRDEDHTLRFLDLLKEESLIRRLPPVPKWQLNSSHPLLISIAPQQYLRLYTLAIDHFLLRDNFPYIREDTLPKNLSPIIGNSVDVVHHIAIERGWVRRIVTDQKLRNRDEYEVHINLLGDCADVGETLRNRDILLNVLRSRSESSPLKNDELWERLKSIKSFNLSHEEFDKWVTLLKNSGILVQVDIDSVNDGVKLDTDKLVVQRIIGRMYVYGVIRSLRILHATRPEQKRALKDIKDNITRFVTTYDKLLSTWAADYALSISLLRSNERKDRYSDMDEVWLSQSHSLVRHLDERENRIYPAIVSLMNSIARRERDYWVARHFVLQEMDKDIRFGFSRGEHEYWLDQAIFRGRVLEERKEREKGNLVEYLRAIRS